MQFLTTLLLNNFWTSNKSSIKIETVKAMLNAKVNYELSCEEFYNKFHDNKAFLQAVTFSEKYSWNKL